LITTVLFYFFAAVLVLAALGVITARNPVHAALFLVLAFVQSAVLWVLLEAEFLAIALVLVYVGAVMVLFLFVVMMLNINVERIRAGFTRYLPLGAAVALVVVFEIANVVWFKSQGLPFLTTPTPLPADYSNTKELGAVIYTQHVFAFEVAAVLLLLAIVSAITLTMRRREGLKVQDVPAQVAVRPQDRVRIMKLKPVRESDLAEESEEIEAAEAAGAAPVGAAREAAKEAVE
jgi:NADH-quinone oxidoreductase subunit J